MKPETFLLKNGIRVVLIERPDSNLVSTNVFVGAGGRYETKPTYGISHFLEHMLFKGTKKYPSAQKFAKKIESVGGLINAWTSEDHTSYWNIVPYQNSFLGFEMLAEQISSPLLLQSEIEMEKGVIIEEIRRANDDPFHFIAGKINEVLWPNHPLESDVLGSEKNIKNISRKNFLSYMEDHYLSQNIIISVAGKINKKIIKKQLEDAFSKVKKGPKKEPEAMDAIQDAPKLAVFKKDLSQSHAIFAYKTFGYKDKRNYALKVLSAVLGEGMSSRMFEEVREKRGLAYAIRAGTETLSDTGYFYVYGGFNLKKTDEALSVIQGVLDSSKTKIKNSEIEKAKEYIRGTYYYSMDSTEKISSTYGRRLMFVPEEMDAEKIIKKINEVSKSEVISLAKEIFTPKNKNLLIHGPYQNKEKFAKILTQ